MRAYLGGPMFDLPNVLFNIDLAGRIRGAGIEVYCPNENQEINDKSRTSISPELVYQRDLDELRACNLFICQVAEDSGTMWEAGMMDCLSTFVNPLRYYGVVGLATDIRLQTPPDPAKAGIDNQSWAINAFIIGGLKLSLGVSNSISDLLIRLAAIRDSHERTID